MKGAGVDDKSMIFVMGDFEPISFRLVTLLTLGGDANG